MKKVALVITGIIFCSAWLHLPALAADTIAIGCVVPLSGGTAHYGVNTKRGLEMAVEEINAKGGVKVKGKTYQMKVEACDDEGKSGPAATCGRKLSSVNKVPIIYTPASWSAFPLMSFNEKMDFIILATSQSPTYTTQGNKLVIRWVNNPATSMGPWVKLVLKHMKENNLNIKAVGVLEVNTEVGKQWAGEFMKQWKNNGGTITGKESIDANQTDYYTQLTSLLGTKPDGIMVGVTDEPTSVVVRQARELGFKGVFISSAACDGRKLLELVKPEWAENSFLEVLAAGLGGPGFEEFNNKYKAKFKEESIFSASLAYEGGKAMAIAIEKAQSLEPAKIKAAFASILPLPECLYCGRDLNPETGETFFPVYLRIVKGGKIIGVKD